MVSVQGSSEDLGQYGWRSYPGILLRLYRSLTSVDQGPRTVDEELSLPWQRIGIATNEIDPDFTKALPIALAWGIGNLELKIIAPGIRVPDGSESQWEPIHAAFTSGEMRCIALSPGCFMGSFDNYKADLARLDACLGRAEQLKAKLVVVFSFARGEAPDDAKIPSSHVQALREAARRAEDHGLTLALENMSGQWADTVPNTVRLLEQVDHPAFGLNWDPGNAAYAGDQNVFPEGYERIKPFMVHFHLKDHILDTPPGRWATLGDGQLDYEAQLRQVVAEGYRGWFVIETHHEPLVENSRRNLDFLRNVLGR